MKSLRVKRSVNEQFVGEKQNFEPVGEQFVGEKHFLELSGGEKMRVRSVGERQRLKSIWVKIWWVKSLLVRVCG